MENSNSADTSKSPHSNQTAVDFERLIESTKGRICHSLHDEESKSYNWMFCKPKLLPLKTFTIEKLEKLQKEAEQNLLQSNLANQ